MRREGGRGKLSAGSASGDDLLLMFWHLLPSLKYPSLNLSVWLGGESSAGLREGLWKKVRACGICIMEGTVCSVPVLYHFSRVLCSRPGIVVVEATCCAVGVYMFVSPFKDALILPPRVRLRS